jgi:acetolactate synthase-1/2/3 large subunit
VTGLTVSQLLLRYLALEGAHKLFGIPGSPLKDLLAAIKEQRADFEYIICRHETGAAYIADGYYRATGKLGVVLVTAGPGATNALTGAITADTGGSAMLVITGEVAEDKFGKGPLQEGVDAGLDVKEVYKAAIAYSAEITNQSELQTLLEQALRVALSLPRRAAHISFPQNILGETVQQIRLPLSTDNYRTTPEGVDADRVRTALEQLLAARRPLLFLGSGCREALRDQRTMRELKDFVERYAIPVMTTPDSKGIFPESHDLSLRVYGFCSSLWALKYLTQRDPPYDGLMVIGSSLRGLSSNNFDGLLVPAGPFIQVDIDEQAIGRAFPISLGIVGQAKACIHVLSGLASQFPPDVATVKKRRNAIADLKKSPPFHYPQRYHSQATPLQPAALVRVLQETLPADAIFMLDHSSAVCWGLHYFQTSPPGQFHSSLAMAPMGFAVSAVVGAKIGRPDKTCLALVGDGAFMMHGAEISTASSHRVGAIWVVLHDEELLAVSQAMDSLFPGEPRLWSSLYRLGNSDFVKFAEGLGAEGYTIDGPTKLARLMPTIIRRANAGKPQVIVADIDTEAVSPFFPPKP